MSFPDLILGGIRLPMLSILDMSQSYEEINSSTLLRLSDGTGVPQSYGWSKVRTTINGPAGWASAGLESIDWKDPAGVSVACIAPMSYISASNVIALPTARRSDTDVTGYAMVGSELVQTAVSVAADTATLTPVAGATAYKVEWLPLLQCFSLNGPPRGLNIASNEHNFSLVLEQL